MFMIFRTMSQKDLWTYAYFLIANEYGHSGGIYTQITHQQLVRTIATNFVDPGQDFC